MKLKYPPHRYTDVQVVGNEPFMVVSAWLDDLSHVDYSDIHETREEADVLREQIRGRCYVARRLLGLPTPLLGS